MKLVLEAHSIEPLRAFSSPAHAVHIFLSDKSCQSDSSFLPPFPTPFLHPSHSHSLLPRIHNGAARKAAATQVIFLPLHLQLLFPRGSCCSSPSSCPRTKSDHSPEACTDIHSKNSASWVEITSLQCSSFQFQLGENGFIETEGHTTNQANCLHSTLYMPVSCNGRKRSCKYHSLSFGSSAFPFFPFILILNNRSH